MFIASGTKLHASDNFELVSESQVRFQIMAVDCCEHVLAALGVGLPSRVTALTSNHSAQLPEQNNAVDLIVIGIPKYPIRRLFISHLRRVYTNVPVLILRRTGGGKYDREESIQGEFILSNQPSDNDLQIVRALRLFLPFKPCAHTQKGSGYNLVREVIRVIAEKYPDPELNLAQVAQALPISPIYLSRILNKKVGVSFRQLLRHTRIEEAKRMLASRHYTVKEVAERVGFSDLHYFSRSFKELTGQSASHYRTQDNIFN